MISFADWMESKTIAGKEILTRDDGITWKQLQGEVDRLLDIIMDPNVSEGDKAEAKELAKKLAIEIKRSNHLERSKELVGV